MSETEFLSLSVSFATFFPQHSERWKFLLKRGESRWAKIDPLEVWPNEHPYRIAPPLKAGLTGIDIAETPRLWSNANEAVVVFTCGHSRVRSVQTMKLGEFAGNCWGRNDLWEGFASVVPGQLLMAWNHEGGACFWDRPRRAK